MPINNAMYLTGRQLGQSLADKGLKPIMADWTSVFKNNPQPFVKDLPGAIAAAWRANPKMMGAGALELGAGVGLGGAGLGYGAYNVMNPNTQRQE
jgi:hypothetical protein